MNSASSRPGLSSNGRDSKSSCRGAPQNDLWIICPNCGWPKATGVTGTPDSVPYDLLGPRRLRCGHCGVLISWTAKFCDTPPHGSAYLDSRKPQAGRESNLRGTVVAFE